MKTHLRIAHCTALLALFALPAGLPAQAVATPPPTRAAAESKNDPVVALDAYHVTDTRPEPFSDRNVDAPRTVNDVQPYMIYNAKIIEESGAINMEDFLRANLTMVNEALPNAGNTTSYGASSNIQLRGLAAAQTLVLVDGRRLPNVYVAGSEYQADLNGIPMSAIDRIEVLPSSASGIYGGSAIAGVINVVLRKNYSGGEVRLTYNTPMDTDAGIRTANISYGRSLEGGRSQLTLTAQYSDAHALTLGDRKSVVVPRIRTILERTPDIYWTPTSPFLGAGVNISSGNANNLVLKPAYGGQTLPSNYTNLAAGTSASTSTAAIGTGLLANAGKYNMNLADVNSNPPATNYITGFTPVTKGFSATFDRKMLPNLDAFVQFNYSSNFAFENYNGHFTGSTISIPAASPINPFTTNAVIKSPLQLVRQRNGTSLTRTLVGGLKARLPKGWTGQFDYTWSQNAAGTFLISVDSTALNADILSGAVNPFVDPLLYPVSLDKYAARQNFTFRQTVNTLALRAAGNLPSLPWGAPRLNFRTERRLDGKQNGTLERVYPLTPASTITTTYLGFLRDIRTANAELNVPLVARRRFPLLNSLEAQLAGGREEHVVAVGTPTMAVTPSTGAITYGAPVLNGLPYRKNVIFTSSNPTVGFKYQPIESLIIRASTGTAFLPPTTAQLAQNPLPNSALTTILDPKTNTSYQVQTLSGGNPNVTPQRSRSDNAGIIWQPKWAWLRGLRLEANYYNIRQSNAIGTLTAQQILNLESSNPGRVTRDATGKVTLIDVSSINLYKRNLEGWDFLLDYRVTTAERGTFTFKARESIVLHSKAQYSLTAPMYEAAGYPLEGGGAMKKRLNTSLAWEDVHWTATWNTRFFDSYFEYGAAGGPLSMQFAAGADYLTYVRALGSRKVDSQIFHDLIIGYNFGRIAAMGRPSGSFLGNRMFDGLSFQLGIKNVFNKAPAFDASPFANGYMSSYGDNRMRSVWLTVKRVF
jgi:outer membrane receptor protein involved in Fe transport